MEHSLIILFKGVCTHLTAMHDVANAPAFDLCARGEEIQHRVFIANSELITKEIRKDRRPDRHVPKLRIHKQHVTDKLRDVMREAPPDAYELDLFGYGVTFENLDPAKGPARHYPDLEPLPSTFFKGGPPDPAPDAALLNGWSVRTGACIDFKVKGGVRFTTGLAEVIAQLWFKGEPELVLRKKNAGAGTPYPLKDNTVLEISNHAVSKCGDWDYLLHYFATNADLWNNPPEWKLPAVVREPAGEVYCTNSTYP